MVNMNRIDKLVMDYSDKMLDINNADDMDYGDRTGAYMALSRHIISDIANIIAKENLDLEDLML